MLLSGADFFIVSRDKNLNLEEQNISIIKESIFYKDTYTIPKGWKKSPEDALKELINFDFQKGNIQRKFYGILDWSELDWQIFNLMKENVRKKISQVSEKTDATYKTVKKHFKENVLPKCSIAHYFFPEGYDNYRYIYLRIKSDYEISLIDSFKKLPCTTYIYLLDDEMNVIIFYKSHFLILETLKKLKEIGILSNYLLYIPIIHGND